MTNQTMRERLGIFGLALLTGLLPGCATYVEPPPPPPVVQPVYVIPPAPPQPVEPQPVQPMYEPPAQPVPPPPNDIPVASPESDAVIEIHTDNDFYGPLGHYGYWVDIPGRGHCWTPAGVSAEWRPYTDGHWERTDAGWYWVSNEPWGWATCHYGRWYQDASYGWVWVPDTQWAPAWVAWREGGGYTGWAPLPPEAHIGAGGALEQPQRDLDSHSFVFVKQPKLLEPQQPQTVIVNNTTIINKTVNITKIVVVNQTIINEGPSPEAVAKAAGRQVAVVPARDLRTHQEAPVINQYHLHSPPPAHDLHPPLENRPDQLENNDRLNRQNAHAPAPAPRPPTEVRQPGVPPGAGQKIIPNTSTNRPTAKPAEPEKSNGPTKEHPANPVREPRPIVPKPIKPEGNSPTNSPAKERKESPNTPVPPQPNQHHPVGPEPARTEPNRPAQPILNQPKPAIHPPTNAPGEPKKQVAPGNNHQLTPAQILELEKKRKETEKKRLEAGEKSAPPTTNSPAHTN